MTFYEELTKLINKHSMENESDTPDYILMEFIKGVLKAYNDTIKKREERAGRKTSGSKDKKVEVIKSKEVKITIKSLTSLKKARKLWNELCSCALNSTEERSKVVEMKDEYEKVIKEIRNFMEE